MPKKPGFINRLRGSFPTSHRPYSAGDLEAGIAPKPSTSSSEAAVSSTSSSVTGLPLEASQTDCRPKRPSRDFSISELLARSMEPVAEPDDLQNRPAMLRRRGQSCAHPPPPPPASYRRRAYTARVSVDDFLSTSTTPAETKTWGTPPSATCEPENLKSQSARAGAQVSSLPAYKEHHKGTFNGEGEEEQHLSGINGWWELPVVKVLKAVEQLEKQDSEEPDEVRDYSPQVKRVTYGSSPTSNSSSTDKAKPLLLSPPSHPPPPPPHQSPIIPTTPIPTNRRCIRAPPISITTATIPIPRRLRGYTDALSPHHRRAFTLVPSPFPTTPSIEWSASPPSPHSPTPPTPGRLIHHPTYTLLGQLLQFARSESGRDGSVAFPHIVECGRDRVVLLRQPKPRKAGEMAGILRDEVYGTEEHGGDEAPRGGWEMERWEGDIGPNETSDGGRTLGAGEEERRGRENFGREDVGKMERNPRWKRTLEKLFGGGMWTSAEG